MKFDIAPIGHIESPYREKFAVPRQPRLARSVTSRVRLCGESNCIEAVRGIEQFSHIWLLFLFDHNLDSGWKPTVRPPRLGGNERVGVFATRSSFRPNGIGMSAVEFKGIEQKGSQVYLQLGSVDLVDATPIVDIKPYIPYSDAITTAFAGFAENEPELIDVNFSHSAEQKLIQAADGQYKRQVILEILSQDPRPAYKKAKADDKEYGVLLFNWNVKFKIIGNTIIVTDILTI